MEFQLSASGRRIYPSTFKKQLLDEMRAGKSTAAELSRRYQIPIQNLVKWKRKEVEQTEKMIVREAKVQDKDESELLAAYRKLHQENEKLRRSLVNMAIERDILKDAVEIATKKKWI